MKKQILFHSRTPFRIKNVWVWKAWMNEHANKHAAIISKADELGASHWDFGQADHEMCV
jgi:hypothetical protein